MEVEQQIKLMIINALDLEEISPEDIIDDEPLFNDGLGLDSIDALELGIALKREFNVQLSKNKEANQKYFYSVQTMADFVRSQQNG